MKTFTKTVFSIVLVALGASAIAQQWVSTQPANKNVVIEEFTGVRCGPCIGGAITLDGILQSNPGRVFGVAMSPNNSGLTAPYGNDEDLRRSYLDAFYSNPYYNNGGSRSMPSAHINRRLYSNARKRSESQWSSAATAFLSESSPMNIGMNSQYNVNNQTLTVDIEVYYTATVSDANTVNLVLIEDNIMTTHAGYTGSYANMHQFREELHSGQWGESITGNTNQGDLKTFQFTFNNSSTNYDMTECHVVAYVSNTSIEEVYTAMQVDADGGFTTNSQATAVQRDFDVTLFPNPMNDFAQIRFDLESGETVSVEITNLLGQQVYSEDLGMKAEGRHYFMLDKAELNLSENLYFVTVTAGEMVKTSKLMVN